MRERRKLVEQMKMESARLSDRAMKEVSSDGTGIGRFLKKQRSNDEERPSEEPIPLETK